MELQDDMQVPDTPQPRQAPHSAVQEPADANTAGGAEPAPPAAGWWARWQEYLLQTLPATLIADGPWLQLTRLVIPTIIAFAFELYGFELVAYGVKGPHAHIECKVQGRDVVMEIPAPVVFTAAVGGLYTALQRAAVAEVMSPPLAIHWLLALSLPRRTRPGWRGVAVRQARLFGVYLAIMVTLQTAGMVLAHQAACMQIPAMSQWTCAKMALVPTRVRKTTFPSRPWAEDVRFDL
eukprot:jgi/Ulvmu1/6711/UM030_0044.1